MSTIFKDIQISDLSYKLNIPKSVVNTILTAYIDYLKAKVLSGETVKFLNVCYLKVDGNPETTHETLAYVSNEIGLAIGQSQNVVYRVLSTYEESIIQDIRSMFSYSIRGLVRLKLEKDYHGNLRVRAKKSTIFDNYNIRVITTCSFKRKAEIMA